MHVNKKSASLEKFSSQLLHLKPLFSLSFFQFVQQPPLNFFKRVISFLSVSFYWSDFKSHSNKID